MKTVLIAFLGLCLCLPLMAQDKEKPLPKDFESLKALAEKGDARAQCYVAEAYVKEGSQEAVKWFRKAAEQEFADAQSDLAKLDPLEHFRPGKPEPTHRMTDLVQ